jgi:hypothetical protein
MTFYFEGKDNSVEVRDFWYGEEVNTPSAEVMLDANFPMGLEVRGEKALKFSQPVGFAGWVRPIAPVETKGAQRRLRSKSSARSLRSCSSMSRSA